MKHVRRQNRVAGVLDKVNAVFRYRHALALKFRLCRRVHQVEFAVLFDGGPGAAAADHFVILIGGKRERLFLPVNKILCGPVSPVHGSPLRLVGVVLIEQVRFAVVEDSTVGVVAPTGTHAGMVGRPVTMAHD